MGERAKFPFQGGQIFSRGPECFKGAREFQGGQTTYKVGANKIIKRRQDRFRGKDRFKGLVRYHHRCTWYQHGQMGRRSKYKPEIRLCY